MVSDRDRGAVALLCLFAIVIAAAQFPVVGLGSAPDGGGPIGTPPAAETGASSADGGGGADGTVDDPDDGTTSTAVDTTAEGSDAATDEAGGTDEPTATAEPTTRETTAASADDADAGGSDGAGKLVLGVLVVAVALGVVGLILFGAGGTRRRDERAGVDVDGPGGRVAAKLLRYLPTVGVGLTGAIGSIPRRTMRFVVGSSRSAPRLFDAVGSAVGEVAAGVGVAGSGLATGLGRVAVRAPAGLVNGLGSLGSAAAGGLLSAPSGAGSLLGGLFGADSTTDRPGADARNAAGVEPEEPTEPERPPPPASVEEAWERMVDAAPVPNWRSKTPVEVASDAVRTGLPVEPVGRLTRLFRRVRYDPTRPGERALSDAREALARIERPGEASGGEDDE